MQKNSKRRRYLINKEIQIGYIVTLFIPLIIIGSLFFILMNLVIDDSTMQSTIGMSEEINAIIREYQQSDTALSSPSVTAMVSSIRESFQQDSAPYNMSTNLHSLVQTIILGVLLGSILMVIIAIHFSHKFVGPVFHISNSCRKVAEGDYREVVNLRDGDKLDDLAENFNLMVSITRMRIHELSAAETSEERSTIVENLKI